MKEKVPDNSHSRMKQAEGEPKGLFQKCVFRDIVIIRGEVVYKYDPAATWPRPEYDSGGLWSKAGNIMEFHFGSSLEPITIVLLLSNLVVWPLHFFLQRRTANILQRK
jgi:hypothetical protein